MTGLGFLTAMFVNFAPPVMHGPSRALPELRDPFAERHPRPPHFHHPDLIDPFGPQKLRTPSRPGDRPSAALPRDPFETSEPHPAPAPAPAPEVAGLVDPFAVPTSTIQRAGQNKF